MVNSTPSRRHRMSTLDEITKEKQRVSEALARVDEQREKLTSQSAGTEQRAAASTRCSDKASTHGPRPGRAPAPTSTLRPSGAMFEHPAVDESYRAAAESLWRAIDTTLSEPPCRLTRHQRPARRSRKVDQPSVHAPKGSA